MSQATVLDPIQTTQAKKPEMVREPMGGRIGMIDEKEQTFESQRTMPSRGSMTFNEVPKVFQQELSNVNLDPTANASGLNLDILGEASQVAESAWNSLGGLTKDTGGALVDLVGRDIFGLGEHQLNQPASNEAPTTINPTTTSITELDPELKRQQDNNEILRVRHFFQEISQTPISLTSNIIRTSQGGVVSLEQVLEAVGFSNTAVSAEVVTDGNGNLRRDLEKAVESPKPSDEQKKKMEREAQLNQAIGNSAPDMNQNKIFEAGSVLSPITAAG